MVFIRAFLAGSCGLCLSLALTGAYPSYAEVQNAQNFVLSSATVEMPVTGKSARSPSKTARHVQISKKTQTVAPPFRGWAFLAEKLRLDGVSEALIRAVYNDPRMPSFSFIPFSLRPKESRAMYKNFLDDNTLQVGRQFLARNKTNFEQAEKIFGVNRRVVAAILLIETHAGQTFGRDLVLNRLSRLASIAEPNNVVLNFRRLQQEDPKVTFEQVRARAEYLEETFYPEVLALFRMKRDKRMDILALKGSSAGAFGMPQFLPSNYLRFGVDANKDGVVSLHHEADAIWSTANFLSHFGWNDGASEEAKRKVIWRYNRSDAYVDTALDVADRLQ